MTATGDLPEAVVIRDVGPRDGLQPEEPLSPRVRVELVERLVDAGLRRIEVAAFVSPKAVPAMAGAAEVATSVPRRPGVVYTALVPNARGAAEALNCRVDELTVTVSASETYNRRNVNMSIAESEDAVGAIAALALEARIPVDVVISCAFGSPYEPELSAADVVALAARLWERGVSAVTFADTTGMATPRRIHELIETLGGDPAAIGLHLHDTRGTALVNAYAALQAGVRRFDTSVGGLGGSPFAHGAGGNLATEALVAMLDDLGVSTGVDIDGVIDAAMFLEPLIGRPLPSGVAHHGPRTRGAESRPQASVGDAGRIPEIS